MEKIMYLCRNCDKLYKVGGSGKNVKCNSCGQELVDLKVSDEEYEKMSAEEKNSLKYSTSEDKSDDLDALFDLGNEEPEKKIGGSLFDSGNEEPVKPGASLFDVGDEDDEPKEEKPKSSGSFFSMMPEDSSADQSYSPIYAFDNNSGGGSSRAVDDPGDDWTEKRINFFLIPVLSFVPTKYRRLVLEKGGKVFGALLVCFVILYFISGIVASAGINKVAVELKSMMPDFDLSNGRLTIETPVLMDEDGTYIEIDDSLSGVDASYIDEVYKSGYYKSIFIGGSDSAAILSDGRVQVIKYSDLSGFEMSRDKLCDKWIPMLKPIIIICMIFGAFFAIGIYYLAALIIQFPAGAIAGAITKHDIGSTQKFRITVLAKFPVFVLVFIIKLVGLKVGFVVNIILQLIFVVLVMYFYSKTEEAGDFA